jgi:hypothetical protein
MSGLYLTWFAEEFRFVGLDVVESSGWQTRARSSGGFPSTPLGVQWHHTASKTSPENDIHWQTVGCDDAPVGNMTIMRDGSVWLVAAGAANTAGKGGPLTLSRGTIPKDSANTRSVAIEVANDGVGEQWPKVQIDSYFLVSNTINKKLGNLPTDVFSHALGAGDGWTDRKIDPAKASAVQGPWKPNSVNSSGTWSLADIRAECLKRSGNVEEDMTDEQAQQLAAIYQQLTGPINERFTDPGGNVLNVPWAVGWTWEYVSQNIDSKLADVISRLDALEADSG